MKVDVLCGGDSSERAGSLLSGKTIADALTRAGFKVRLRDITPSNIADLVNDRPDVAFPVIHGGFGEDGRLQGLLEILNVAYVGSSPLACAISQDKTAFSRHVRALGYKTPTQEIIDAPLSNVASIYSPKNVKEQHLPHHKTLPTLSYPLVMKPVDLGCSYGVFYLETAEDFLKHAPFVGTFSSKILLESYIEGAEYTIGLYSDHGITRSLPLAQSILHGRKIVDFEVKYPGSEHLCTTNIVNNTQVAQYKEVEKQAIHIFESMDSSGYTRMDLRITPTGEIFFLENNTSPGMISEAESDFPKMLHAQGIDLPSFTKTMVETAINRHRQRQTKQIPGEKEMTAYLGLKFM